MIKSFPETFEVKQRSLLGGLRSRLRLSEKVTGEREEDTGRDCAFEGFAKARF
jgi:hypothetical protein